jgi:hypothetical protein
MNKNNEGEKMNKTTNYTVMIYEEDGTRAELPQFHFRGFQVKYYPPTDYKGSRIKIYDTRHKKTVWVSYDYLYSDIKSQAIDYLWKKGIESDGFTYDEKTGVYTILTTNFSTDLKQNSKGENNGS